MAPSAAPVRHATIEDLDALQGLEEATFPPSDVFQRGQWRYLLTRAHAFTLVIRGRGRIAGAAVILWRRNSSKARLYSIAVNPALQGRGLGSRLLDACEAQARRRGSTEMRLEVRASNDQARGFYQRHGYAIVETVPDYYLDGADGLRMSKKLVIRRRVKKQSSSQLVKRSG